MAKTLLVEIVAEAAAYGRELKVAAAETEAFGSKAAKAGAVVGKAFLATGAVVAGVSAIIGYHSVKAASEAEASAARLDNAFKQNDMTIRSNSERVEKLEEDNRKLGFTNEDTRDSLMRLIQSGHSWSDSMKLMGTAHDLARAKAMDYGEATTALIRLQTGNTRAARQFGLVLPPVTKNVDKLKASHIDLTTAQGKHLLAMAKVQDKMATGQSYVDALTKKIHGQADAYSKTAAGGMQQFHAQMENLEENIGSRLIPGLTNILNWTNAHWPQIEATIDAVMTGIGFAINQVAVPAIKMLIDWTRQAVEFIRAHWDQISSYTMKAFNDVKAVIMGAVGVIQALWSRFGDQIMSQLRAVWDFVKSYVQAAMKVIQGIINVVMGLIHGDWSRAWEGIKQIFSGVWQALQAELKYVWATFKNVLEAGLKALLLFWQTEWNMLKAIVGRAWDAVVALLGAVKDSLVGAGKAVIDGFKRGIDQAWQAVIHFFTSVKSMIFNAIGKVGDLLKGAGWALVHGFLDGIKSGWHSVTGWLRDNTVGLPGKVYGWLKGSPQLFTYYLGQDLVKQLVAGMQKQMGGLGAAVGQVAGSVKKGLGNAAGAIIAAARKVGVDARAALAVAMTEGGTSFGAVGDSGTSFGPFQLHIGGASPFSDPGKAKAFANSIQGITYALKQMAAAGASGKTGFDAIRAIVYSFERPANPSAEVAKALAYYKEIPAQLGGALATAGTMTRAQQVKTLNEIGQLVHNASKVIGLDHARQIVAGLDLGAKDIVARSKKALADAMAAARQAVLDAKAGLVSAFRQVATDALAAYDEVTANFKSPSSILLANMQDEDARAARDKAAKDAADTVQAAQDAAAAARAAGPQEGETPEQFAARLAGLDQAYTDAVIAQGDTLRGIYEQQLGDRATAETTAWEEHRARLREQLAGELLDIQTSLAKHPKEYAKAQQMIINVMKKYHVPMHKAGQELASRFSDGLNEGIATIVAAARKLADALEGIPGVKGAGGGGTSPGAAGGPSRPPDVGGGRTNAATNITVHVNGDVTGDEVVQKVRDGLRRLARNDGANPLTV